VLLLKWSYETINMPDNSTWSFDTIWNKSLEEPQNRETIARDYLWASELGKPYLDVYMRMNGVEPTNPPNPRSLRKFEAGNLWESIVEVILTRAGIMQASQERVEYTFEGMLRVSGKIDFIAGGKIDQAQSLEYVSQLSLPENTLKAIDRIIDYLATNYPNGLEKRALEVKSVSSHMMNAIEKTERALKIHRLQAYHYTKHPDIDRADIVYICRDDCRMKSIPVLGEHPAIEAEYRDWIETMSGYYLRKEEPPKASPITFDEDQGKFALERAIGWSPYLTLCYGFQDQMEFEDKYGKIPASWNRVLTRIKSGQSMTANNLEKIEEMKQWGFDAYTLAEKLVDSADEDETHDS